MRGEYVIMCRIGCSMMELPPRARRIPGPTVCGSGVRGTTSACAENTKQRAFHPTHPRNYLRVRGEYFGVECLGWGDWELPPRARRIRCYSRSRGLSGGTTSACAENTCSLSTPPCHGWNYLRVRGEYLLATRGCGGGLELPPRARRIPHRVENHH